ncbi:MAG: class I SAM-dependent methyltransferase [Cellvibrionaceae bacterium]
MNDLGVAIQQSGNGAPGPVMVDFVGGKLGFRRRRQGPTPTIVKAAGVRSDIRPEVWDLTAGLGQDAFVLALYGCSVTMFERQPIIHCLLVDALDRARDYSGEDGESLHTIIDRLTLRQSDSIKVLSDLDDKADRPEVIYIDTMFPERSKTAKIKKGMQVFQQLLGEDSDSVQLLELALQCARNRVVVKRPKLGEALGLHPPNLQFSGKSIRFDVYTIKKLERGKGKTGKTTNSGG